MPVKHGIIKSSNELLYITYYTYIRIIYSKHIAAHLNNLLKIRPFGSVSFVRFIASVRLVFLPRVWEGSHPRIYIESRGGCLQVLLRPASNRHVGSPFCVVFVLEKPTANHPGRSCSPLFYGTSTAGSARPKPSGSATSVHDRMLNSCPCQNRRDMSA